MVSSASFVGHLNHPFDPFPTAEVGYTGCAAILSAILYLLYRSPHPVTEDADTPGSSREIEAQMAAADEIG